MQEGRRDENKNGALENLQRSFQRRSLSISFFDVQ